MRRDRTSRGRTRRSPIELRPIPGPDAFADSKRLSHVYSQAATLLLIGAHLRGDAASTQARVRAAVGLTQLREAEVVDVVPVADVQALGFPAMQVGALRFGPKELRRAVGVRFAAPPGAEPAPRDVKIATRHLARVARAFYLDTNPETAAALLEVGLRHTHELVRVAAASSYFDLATDPARALRTLARGLRSRDPLIRDVAAHTIAHVDPQNKDLARLLQSRRKRSTRKRSHTSLVVHGTWARTSSWWQPPNGDFWRYLHDNVDATLYGAQDRFEWSGGYSDAARALAGNDLQSWVQQHTLTGLDLFAHSHGGSVAMLANQAGTRLGSLVLLSCPVHWPQYMPNFNLVAKVVSVRVHLDLVILADRGGQRFHDGRIQEHVLPIWFDHFATHDPANWQRYDVPAML